MRLCLQHRPYTIGVFEFNKAEASRLIRSFVLHDDTIDYFPILRKVVSKCLWEKKERKKWNNSAASWKICTETYNCTINVIGAITRSSLYIENKEM